MKTLINAILIFVIVCVFSVSCDIYLNKSVKEMTKLIDNVNSYVVKKDYQNAKETFSDLKENWEKKEKFIQIQTEHNELDIINEQFAVISSHFDNDEYDEFFETLYKLKYFINHITEKKRLNLNTIL